MGCLHSTPGVSSSSPSSSSRDGEKKSELVQLNEQELSTDQDHKDHKDRKDDGNENENDIKGKIEKNKFNVETETTNILYSKKESGSESNENKNVPSPPASVPQTPPSIDSPKPQRQRTSIESSSDKKLKLSELLHAEKMKKTSGNISSSGEVINI